MTLSYRLVGKMPFLHSTLRHRQKLQLFNGVENIFALSRFCYLGGGLSDLYSDFNRKLFLISSLAFQALQVYVTPHQEWPKNDTDLGSWNIFPHLRQI